MKCKQCFLFTLIFFLALNANGQQRRIALVIGNGNYEYSGKLANPVNDAELMAKTLESLDFTVIKQYDADKQAMEKYIYEFSKKLNDYNVALFYYAGHGIQVNGTNFLLPIDAVLEDKIAAEFEAIDVGDVVSQFERHPNNTNIVILDACRNNPFKSFSRGGESGFSAMPAPSGTIIAFATAEGSTASDGADGNGLYTSVLASEMKNPQRIEDVFINTRVKVREISNYEQSPQEWSQLTGKFYFATRDGLGSAISSSEVVNGRDVREKHDTDNIALDRGKISSGGYEAKAHIAQLLKQYDISQILEMGIPSSFLIGIEYSGGIIANLDKSKNTYLLVATKDQTRGTPVNWEEAKSMCSFYSTGDGKEWRLPSKEELMLLHENLMMKNYGEFTDESYWSSTKSGYNNAWGISFSSGRSYDFDKLSTHHVRAVRLVAID